MLFDRSERDFTLFEKNSRKKHMTQVEFYSAEKVYEHKFGDEGVPYPFTVILNKATGETIGVVDGHICGE